MRQSNARRSGRRQPKQHPEHGGGDGGSTEDDRRRRQVDPFAEQAGEAEQQHGNVQRRQRGNAPGAGIDFDGLLGHRKQSVG